MSRTPPVVDRVAASKAAVAARRARAQVKSDIASGARTPIEVLDASLDRANAAESTLRVTQFLLAIPHIGPTKATRLLEELAISESKRLGGLGRQQRLRLRNHLRLMSAAKLGHRRLLVLAGPTAVGKGTVTQHIREQHPGIFISVSVTTRAPRAGEVPGESYHFVSDEEFDRMLAAGELLEHAVVHGSHRYGTPRGPIEAAIAVGKPSMLEIDLQGARQVKAAMPEARLVFLLPPSWDELVNRLVGRGTESPEEQARRLSTARHELSMQHEFDDRIVNETVPEAARQVVALLGITEEGISE